jgi:hypothetical protein
MSAQMSISKKQLRGKIKKQFLAFIGVAFLLLGGATYFFLFTYKGQEILYDVFGGNNLHIVSNNQELFWFYAHHRNDPNAPIFQRIENALSKFSPDLVLVEGGADKFEGSRDEAIYAGESSFTAYHAKENKIPVEDIEPPLTSQIEYLQSKYGADRILAMYLIRQICSELIMSDNSKWDFDHEMLVHTKYFKENGLDYKGETVEDILNTVNAFLPKALDNANWRDVDFKYLYSVYAGKDGVLYPIYNDITNFRNIYLVEFIKEKKNEYDRIFIVMGGGHLDATRKLLNELYGSACH